MAQPLYFLPGLTRAVLCPGEKLSRSLLRERGLAEVFDDVGIGRQDFGTCELAGRGPGNHSGIILFYHRPDGGIPKRCGYYPKEQQWEQVDDGLWLGLDTDDLPKPEDLERRKQYGGYTLELADGLRWTVPVIRRPDGTTNLPTDLYWDKAGLLVEPLKERYRAYWDETAEVAEWFFGERGFDSESFEKGKALALCIRALGLNYRYGRAEQNLLRAVDLESYLFLLSATVDVPKATEINEAQKKSGAASSTPSSTTGQTEVEPDTLPVEAS